MTNHSVARDTGVADATRPEHSVRHLDQEKLARRWSLSPRTLERWRWLRKGPPHMKIGGRVIYNVADIEAWEAARTRLGAG